MEKKHSTAVLIHGLHLEADDWERMVWGDPQNGVWGVIPRGVEAAWRERARVLVWGTGASEKDGLKESEYTYRFALDRIDALSALCGCTASELQAFLEERSHTDTETQNTREEVRSFLDRCLKEGATDIMLVAAASLAPRSIRTVLSLVTSDSAYAAFRHAVRMAPSDTVFPGTTMEDVVIFERPHRGDRPKNDNHILARRTLDVLKTDARDAFLSDWETLLKQYEDRA